MEVGQDGQNTVSREIRTDVSTGDCDTELTEENVKYFNDTLVNRGEFTNLSVSPRGIPVESSDIKRINRVTGNTLRQSKVVKDSVQIIPNDRNLPMFLQDDIEQMLSIPYLDGGSSVDSKGVQTCISGVRTMSNLLWGTNTKLTHRAAILNTSTTQSKDATSSSEYNSELSLTRSQLYNVHCNYQKLKLRFHKLHEDYYKLISVAGKLTVALENSARGNPADLPSILKSCIKVHPELFSQNVRDDSTEINFVKSWIDIEEHDLTESKQPILGVAPLCCKELDFKKIKLHLINGNVKTKLLLLQALRWKITLTQQAERDEAIHEYTSSDLLGLHGQIASDSGKSILPYLLIPLDVVLPHPLQQSTARLLNTLASLRCGRDYLSVGPAVLNVVVQCLDTARVESVDALTCDMIIAMLQKMSLRRQQRLYMIGMGLVEWLIYHLKSERLKIGTYRLEFATALLMNLSLHREAQVRAATMTTMVLSTLTELLSSAHLPALPYVNGALNNFLANHTINEEAKKIGLDSVLEYHRRRNSGEIRKHLDYILKRHRRASTEITEDDIIADDDSEELDMLENELDELDPVKVHPGELFGEALLATCYSAMPNDPRQLNLDKNNISSLKYSKVTLTNPSKIRHKGPHEKQQNVLFLEKSTSPSMNAPRFTPPQLTLTITNTTPLKLIQLHKKHEGREIQHSLPRMVDKSVGMLNVSEYSSESEIDNSDKLTPLSGSSNEDFDYLYANEASKDSGTTAVNSVATMVSTYESAAEGQGRMSSIASLSDPSEKNCDVVPSNETEKVQDEGDEEAFISKPRIMRTPPQSAILRIYTPSDADEIDPEMPRTTMNGMTNNLSNPFIE